MCVTVGILLNAQADVLAMEIFFKKKRLPRKNGFASTSV
jgi:hypothetical protein